jgi:hypothetical protein
MPKYYITCLSDQTVVEATDSLDACVKAMNKMCVATVGVGWIISERGFAKHDDDEVIPDYDIINESIRRQKNK